MIEFLRHALGLCGEPHPSILMVSIGTPVLYVFYWVRSLFTKQKDYDSK